MVVLLAMNFLESWSVLPILLRAWPMSCEPWEPLVESFGLTPACDALASGAFLPFRDRAARACSR